MPYASLSVGWEEQYVDTLLGNPDSLALRFVWAIAAWAQWGIDLPDPLATIPTGRKCYAWSKEEDAAHEIFETHASQLAQRLNLVLWQDYEFSIDAIGNSFFTVFWTDEYKARKSQTEKKGAKTKKGTKSDFITPSIIIGSHLDSTPNGWIYDGVLGVWAGLEAVEKILSAGKKPKKNITIVAWRGEESSPNNWVGCFWSQIATGQLSMDQLKKVEYQKGINFLQHLADHNWLSIEAMEAKIAAMIKTPYVNMKRFPDTLELHIEQSAILENRGQDLGIVTGGIGGSRREVWSDTLTRVETLDTYGYKKVRISAHGFRGHTGGTPPNPALISTNLEWEDIMYRKDALVWLGNLLSMLYTSDDQSNNALERIKVSHVWFAEPLQFTSIPDSA